MFDKLNQESVTSGEHGWKKRLDVKEWKNDFKMSMYSKKVAGSKNDQFRSHTKYRNMSLQKISNFFKNLPADKFDFIIEEKYVDIQESADKKDWSCVRLRVTGNVPLISDRESVSIVNFKYTDDGKVFICSKSIDDERFPERKGKVRIFNTEVYELYETVENGE